MPFDLCFDAAGDDRVEGIFHAQTGQKPGRERSEGSDGVDIAYITSAAAADGLLLAEGTVTLF